MSDARSNSYTMISHNRPFKVAVCVVTLVAFLFNIVSYDLAWAARTPSALTSVGTDRAVSPGVLKELNPTTFTLPQNLGTIKDSWFSKNARTIIHIQDAHCNYYAQKKISEIIKYLNDKYGVSTINLEGGAKDYDISIFTDIKDRAKREKAADYFVKEGVVNGAEYFAINNPEKITLWGIEDVGLYIDNLKTYRNSLKYKDEVDKYFKNLSYILSNLKLKIYSKELLELDSRYNAYKVNNAEFKDYLSYLMRKAKERMIDIKSYANIYLLSQTLGQESGIDFRKANNERDELIDKLGKRLSKNALEELVLKTVEFKSERISQADFYQYLANKAKSINLKLDDFPELAKYSVYVATYQATDKAKIMNEVASLEDKLKASLFTNDKDRELDVLSKNLALMKNMFNISLTREDYNYYQNNRASFDARNYVKFIEREAPLYKITAKLDSNIAKLDDYREDISKFYEYSFKRDKAFLKNINLKKTSIIVTGGFHTENLAEMFKKQGISYVSIMPNFKNCDGYDCPYFKILSGGKSLSIRETLPSVLNKALATNSQFCRALNDPTDGIVPSGVREIGSTPTLPVAAPQTTPAPAATEGSAMAKQVIQEMIEDGTIMNSVENGNIESLKNTIKAVAAWVIDSDRGVPFGEGIDLLGRMTHLSGDADVRGAAMDALLEIFETASDKKGEDERYGRIAMAAFDALIKYCVPAGFDNYPQLRRILLSEKPGFEVLSTIAKFSNNARTRPLAYLILQRFAKEEKTRVHEMFLHQIFGSRDIDVRVRLLALGLQIQAGYVKEIGKDVMKDEIVNMMRELGSHDIHKNEAETNIMFQILSSPAGVYEMKAMLIGLLLWTRDSMGVNIFDAKAEINSIVSDTRIIRGLNQAYSDLGFGSKILKEGGAREMLFILAHELSHRILFADYKMRSITLDNNAADELLSDILPCALFENMGWSKSNINKLLNWERDYENVRSGGLALEQHQAARAQIVSMRNAGIESGDHPKAWSHLYKAALRTLVSEFSGYNRELDFYEFVRKALIEYSKASLGNTNIKDDLGKTARKSVSVVASALIEKYVPTVSEETIKGILNPAAPSARANEVSETPSEARGAVAPAAVKSEGGGMWFTNSVWAKWAWGMETLISLGAAYGVLTLFGLQDYASLVGLALAPPAIFWAGHAFNTNYDRNLVARLAIAKFVISSTAALSIAFGSIPLVIFTTVLTTVLLLYHRSQNLKVTAPSAAVAPAAAKPAQGLVGDESGSVNVLPLLGVMAGLLAFSMAPFWAVALGGISIIILAPTIANVMIAKTVFPAISAASGVSGWLAQKRLALKYSLREIEYPDIVLSVEDIMNHHIPAFQKIKLTAKKSIKISVLYGLIKMAAYFIDIDIKKTMPAKNDINGWAAYISDDFDPSHAIVTARNVGIFGEKNGCDLFEVAAEEVNSRPWGRKLAEGTSVGSYYGPMFNHHGSTKVVDGQKVQFIGDRPVNEVVNSLAEMFGIPMIFLYCCNPEGGNLGGKVNIPVIYSKSIAATQRLPGVFTRDKIRATQWIIQFPSGLEMPYSNYVKIYGSLHIGSEFTEANMPSPSAADTQMSDMLNRRAFLTKAAKAGAGAVLLASPIGSVLNAGEKEPADKAMTGAEFRAAVLKRLTGEDKAIFEEYINKIKDSSRVSMDYIYKSVIEASSEKDAEKRIRILYLILISIDHSATSFDIMLSNYDFYEGCKNKGCASIFIFYFQNWLNTGGIIYSEERERTINRWKREKALEALDRNIFNSLSATGLIQIDKAFKSVWHSDSRKVSPALLKNIVFRSDGSLTVKLPYDSKELAEIEKDFVEVVIDYDIVESLDNTLTTVFLNFENIDPVDPLIKFCAGLKNRYKDNRAKLRILKLEFIQRLYTILSEQRGGAQAKMIMQEIEKIGHELHEIKDNFYIERFLIEVERQYSMGMGDNVSQETLAELSSLIIEIKEGDIMWRLLAEGPTPAVLVFMAKLQAMRQGSVRKFENICKLFWNNIFYELPKSDDPYYYPAVIESNLNNNLKAVMKALEFKDVQNVFFKELEIYAREQLKRTKLALVRKVLTTLYLDEKASPECRIRLLRSISMMLNNIVQGRGEFDIKRFEQVDKILSDIMPIVEKDAIYLADLRKGAQGLIDDYFEFLVQVDSFYRYIESMPKASNSFNNVKTGSTPAAFNILKNIYTNEEIRPEVRADALDAIRKLLKNIETPDQKKADEILVKILPVVRKDADALVAASGEFKISRTFNYIKFYNHVIKYLIKNKKQLDIPISSSPAVGQLALMDYGLAKDNDAIPYKDLIKSIVEYKDTIATPGEKKEIERRLKGIMEFLRKNPSLSAVTSAAPLIAAAATAKLRAVEGAAHEGEELLEEVKMAAAKLEEKAGKRTDNPKFVPKNLDRLVAALQSKHTPEEIKEIRKMLELLKPIGFAGDVVEGFENRIFLINVAEKRIALGRERLGAVIIMHDGRREIVFPRIKLERLAELGLNTVTDVDQLGPEARRIIGDILHEIIEIGALSRNIPEYEAHYYAQHVQDALIKEGLSAAKVEFKKARLQINDPYRLARTERRFAVTISTILKEMGKDANDLNDLTGDEITLIREKFIEMTRSQGDFVSEPFEKFILSCITRGNLKNYINGMNRRKRLERHFDGRDLLVILQRLHALASDMPRFYMTEEAIVSFGKRSMLYDLLTGGEGAPNVIPTPAVEYEILKLSGLAGSEWDNIKIKFETVKKEPDSITKLLEKWQASAKSGRTEEAAKYIEQIWNKFMSLEKSDRQGWLLNIMAVCDFFKIDPMKMTKNSILNWLVRCHEQGITVEKSGASLRKISHGVREHFVHNGILRLLNACANKEILKRVVITRFVDRGADGLALIGNDATTGKADIIVKIITPEKAGEEQIPDEVLLRRSDKAARRLNSIISATRNNPYFAENIAILRIKYGLHTEDVVEIDRFVPNVGNVKTLVDDIGHWNVGGPEMIHVAAEVVLGAAFLLDPAMMGQESYMDNDIDNLENFLVMPNGNVRLVDFSKIYTVSDVVETNRQTDSGPQNEANLNMIYKRRVLLTVISIILGEEGMGQWMADDDLIGNLSKYEDIFAKRYGSGRSYRLASEILLPIVAIYISNQSGVVNQLYDLGRSLEGEYRAIADSSLISKGPSPIKGAANVSDVITPRLPVIAGAAHGPDAAPAVETAGVKQAAEANMQAVFAMNILYRNNKRALISRIIDDVKLRLAKSETINWTDTVFQLYSYNLLGEDNVIEFLNSNGIDASAVDRALRDIMVFPNHYRDDTVGQEITLEKLSRMTEGERTGRNWFWDEFPQDMRRKVIDRLNAINMSNLVSLVQNTLHKKLPFGTQVKILSIAVKGSYAYRLIEDAVPTDIDLTVIVEGLDGTKTAFGLSLKDEKLFKGGTLLVPESTDIIYLPPKAAAISEETYGEALSHSATIWGNNIVLYGQDISRRRPSDEILFAKSLNLISDGLQFIAKDIGLEDDIRYNKTFKRLAEANMILKQLMPQLDVDWPSMRSMLDRYERYLAQKNELMSLDRLQRPSKEADLNAELERAIGGFFYDTYARAVHVAENLEKVNTPYTEQLRIQMARIHNLINITFDRSLTDDICKEGNAAMLAAIRGVVEVTVETADWNARNAENHKWVNKQPLPGLTDLEKDAAIDIASTMITFSEMEQITDENLKAELLKEFGFSDPSDLNNFTDQAISNAIRQQGGIDIIGIAVKDLINEWKMKDKTPLEKFDALIKPYPELSKEAIIQKLRSAMASLAPGENKEAAEILGMLKYTIGVCVGIKGLLNSTNVPEKPTFMFIPILSDKLSKLESGVIHKEAQDALRSVKDELWRGFRINTITVVFYNGAIDDDGKDNLNAKMALHPDVQQDNTIVYIDGNRNGAGSYKEISSSYITVRDVAKEGGNFCSGYISVRGHIALGLGLLQIVKTPDDKSYYQKILELMTRLSYNGYGVESLPRDAKRFIEVLKNGDINIMLPPMKEENIEKNMRDYIATETAAMESV